MFLPDKAYFPLYLAPMAGVTDPIFRTLCKECGADVMETEFVSAEGVLQAWERNRRYVEFAAEHRPLGVQIFGSVVCRAESCWHLDDALRYHSLLPSQEGKRLILTLS